MILIALGLRHIVAGMATPCEKSSEQNPSRAANLRSKLSSWALYWPFSDFCSCKN
nr:hypothetical protein [Rhodoferax sp.]